MKRRASVRLSVLFSVLSFDSSSGVRRVCCWAVCGQEISLSTESGGHRAPRSNSAAARRSAANAGSAMLTAEGRGWTQTCYVFISFVQFMWQTTCLCTAVYILPRFTARCYASAVLAMGLCPCLSVCLSVCVCLSQAGVLLKRQNVGSHKQYHTIAQGL